MKFLNPNPLSAEQGLVDLLNYAHVVEDGVLVNKDGAFLVTYALQGQDLHSATGEELDALTEQVNRMLLLLEDGWMIHLDELRVPSVYPFYAQPGVFLDAIPRLIEEERRAAYAAEGAHFENKQFLTFVWKWPLTTVKVTRQWFIDGLNADDTGNSLSNLLQSFNDKVGRCIALLQNSIKLHRLDITALLAYLNTCISGELLPVNPPMDGCFVDVALGRRALIGGFVPQVGDKKVTVLSLTGYQQPQTHGGLLDELMTYPLVYRFSNRFIPLSKATAEREIKRYQKRWNNKIRGFMGVLKEVVSGKVSNKVDVDAAQMSGQTTDALTINSNQSVRFGYWTASLVLMHEEQALLEQASRALSHYIEQAGFACFREGINALDAWRGTIPGHGSANVRRVFLSSQNAAHVMPLYSVWTGAATSSPHSLLPKNSPPLLHAVTTGKIPFRLHLDVGDLGHLLLLGPSGAGKSTAIDLFAVQFLRYPNAQIYIFDKDYSHQGLTQALGKPYYDLGKMERPVFAPLHFLASETQKTRAKQFVEDLVELQNIVLTPEIRQAIHEGVEAVAQLTHPTLTMLCQRIQHQAVRQALTYYTLNGQFKLLDASADTLAHNQSNWQAFEMGWLLEQKPEVYLPVLRYLFDQIELRLEETNASHPTLIILEEAWLYISHPVFANKLKNWLKTLRKKNARILFASQSLIDLYDTKTGSLTAVTAALIESCPTKIYLPNDKATSEIRNLYQKMDLSSRQIEIITRIAEAKRHYYVVTPEGNRLIELGLKPQSFASAFMGLSKEKTKKLQNCQEHYGEEWLAEWLAMQGVIDTVKNLSRDAATEMPKMPNQESE